jgi:hypothetical protein
MSLLEFYLNAAHSLNTRLRKNEADLVDVKFPSEVFFPQKDLLIILVDNDQRFLSQTEKLLKELLENITVKFKKASDKLECLSCLKNNPDLVIIGDPLDYPGLELSHLINETNPKQRVICIGNHREEKIFENHHFGLKSLLIQDVTSYSILYSMVKSHIE